MTWDARHPWWHRGCSSMVEHQLPKLNTRVRFPPSAPSSLNTSFKTSILSDIVCHAKIQHGPPQLSVLVIKTFFTGCECWTSVFVNVFRNLLLARACNFNAGALFPWEMPISAFRAMQRALVSELKVSERWSQASLTICREVEGLWQQHTTARARGWYATTKVINGEMYEWSTFRR